MYAYQIKMALFVITSALSLTAGMGMGALLPVTPTLSKPAPHRPAPNRQQKQQRGRLQGGGKPVDTTRAFKKEQAAFKNLDFTEFDENLMEMLKKPKSTIRPSVAYNPEYYTPPSRLPTLYQKPPSPNVPQPTALQPSQPLPLTGGFRENSVARTRYQMNTSWF
jgi:hypothetical protein